jgi:hypothetical protein
VIEEELSLWAGREILKGATDGWRRQLTVQGGSPCLRLWTSLSFSTRGFLWLGGKHVSHPNFVSKWPLLQIC